VTAHAALPSLFESPCAEQRLEQAVAFLRGLTPEQGVLIVANSLLSAQWLVARTFSGNSAPFARFNWQRKSLSQLVEVLALPELAAAECIPLHGLGRLGLCTRVVHLLRAQQALGRYAQIAFTPGFVRALAQTVNELRQARVTVTQLAHHDPDLARFLECYEAELARLNLADSAELLGYATRAARAQHPFVGLPLLLLDVELTYSAQAELIAALSERAPPVCAVVPRRDERSEGLLHMALHDLRVTRLRPAGDDDLTRLKLGLFEARDVPVLPVQRGAVQIISSPGEGREAVEVVRAIQQAAAEGVAFDRIAVCLRAVEVYRSAIEEAFERAALPAYFAEGVRRPLPEGRALLLLLSCARDGLSRKALSEYLSLAVFPRPKDGTPSGASRWERQLLRAGVGGDAARWLRRLELLRAQLVVRGDEPHADDVEREEVARELLALDRLRELLAGLLPALEALHGAHTWGGLLAATEAVARLALADSDEVCEVLAELAPLSELGPVSIADAERVLAQRLSATVRRSSGYGAGKVLVATPAELRGRSFERVFVLGLAEQLFPPRLHEDPLLPDRVRRALGAELPLLEERAAEERLALRIGVGAAQHRLGLSYPRFDAEHSRPRVPSFYGLAVLQAMDGTLPAFDELARRAAPGAAARMGFPAPEQPELAIDDAEYDLAVLSELLRAPARQRVGGLHHLLSHPHLARALRARARRWSVSRFMGADGLVLEPDSTRALLGRHQLDQRAYSASNLALMASCPYRFYLQAIQGLRPPDADADQEGLPARERGVLMHRVQQRVLSELTQLAALPLAAERLPEALALLREAFAELALASAEQRGLDSTQPWAESLASLQLDLEEWLTLMTREPDWIPRYFELGFGVTKERHALDARSVSEPVVLERLRLSGVIDLVEQRAQPDESGRPVLRVTDYKSGRRVEKRHFVSDGGRALQPLLYGLALERLFPEARVISGRLYFCTSRGDFASDVVPLEPSARALFEDWSGAVDALLRDGLLPAAPAPAACATCPCLPVCGPYEEERVAHVKHEGLRRLAPLSRIRNLP
jgi:RecB family exonuclease